MLARSIARHVVRVRTTRTLARRPLYEHVPGRHTASTQLETPLYDPYDPHPPLYEPEGPGDAIEDIGKAEGSSKWDLKTVLTLQTDETEPELDDETLLGFYRNLVVSGSEGHLERDTKVIEEDRRISKVERRQILANLEKRLRVFKGETLGTGQETTTNLISEDQTQLHEPSLTGGVVEVAGPSAVNPTITPTLTSSPVPRSQRILDILAGLDLPDTPANDFGGDVGKGKGRQNAVPHLPMGLVTLTEWKALLLDFLAANQPKDAERVLHEMACSFAVKQRHGYAPVERWVKKVVDAHAVAGNVRDVQHFHVILKQLTQSADEHQAALTRAILHQSGHEKAIQFLREREEKGKPLSQQAYQVVLEHLSRSSHLHRIDSHTRALARDLFAHMRLMAHPEPSREVYRTMLQACAVSTDPQPERARDLWIEMTSEGSSPAIEPEKDDYDAIIRALCTSKDDYLEGFDIFRQMLGKHQDATRIPFEDTPRSIWSKYVPTMDTFSALLQGTKRAGDLERTRWLLLEIVKLVQAAALVKDMEIQAPNNKIVVDVLHAYATWEPTTRNIPTVTVDEAVDDAEAGPSSVKAGSDSSEYEDVDIASLGASAEGAVETAEDDAATPAYTPSPLPKTRKEALQEATSIWERVLYDVKSNQKGTPSLLEHPFARVWLDINLINAYLSVVLKHSSSVDQARSLWLKAFEDANEALGHRPTTAASGTARTAGHRHEGVQLRDDGTKTRKAPNGRSYLLALEYCASSPDRAARIDWDKEGAYAWAQDLWIRYRQLLDSRQPLRQLLLGHPIPESASTTHGEREASAQTPVDADPVDPVDDASSQKVFEEASGSQTVIDQRLRSRIRAVLQTEGFSERHIERAWKYMIRIHALNGSPISALRLYRRFYNLYPPNDILETYRPYNPSGLHMRMDDPTALAEPDVPPHLTFNDVADLHQALVLGRGVPNEEKRLRGIRQLTKLAKTYEGVLLKRRRWRREGRGTSEEHQPKRDTLRVRSRDERRRISPRETTARVAEGNEDLQTGVRGVDEDQDSARQEQHQQHGGAALSLERSVEPLAQQERDAPRKATPLKPSRTPQPRREEVWANGGLLRVETETGTEVKTRNSSSEQVRSRSTISPINAQTPTQFEPITQSQGEISADLAAELARISEDVMEDIGAGPSPSGSGLQGKKASARVGGDAGRTSKMRTRMKLGERAVEREEGEEREEVVSGSKVGSKTSVRRKNVVRRPTL